MSKFYFVLFVFFIGFVACKKSEEVKPGSVVTEVAEYTESGRPKNLEAYNEITDGLKDYYQAGYFEIGGAIEPSSIDNVSEVALMKRHLSSLTAENAMKWSSIQAVEGSFTFANADKIVNFARDNGIKVRGHCLVWHNQVPDWVFFDGGATISKEALIERMKTHIDTVVKHFKGKVYAWDVVNEAIDDGNNIYKATKWYNICGEDFIIEAFRAARLADPDAKLFYNDYSSVYPTKRDKIFTLLQKLKDENLIDGIGLQGHWNIDAPSSETITAAFDKYKSLGIELHITELDVSVYPNDSDPQTSYTSTIESKQANTFARFFNLFRENNDCISSVTLWGLADNHTWLDNFPVSGRKNYPLLFNSSYNPKKAYFSIIDF